MPRSQERFSIFERWFYVKSYDTGLTFSEKWNTSNLLTTEVSLQDLLKGAKFSAASTFAPQTGFVYSFL